MATIAQIKLPNNTTYDIRDNSKLPLDGGTVTGTLILSRNQDAAPTSNNKPALIVGGTDTQAHLELDANELMAKGSGTTTADLWINGGGGKVYLSGTTIYADGTTMYATTFSGTASNATTTADTSNTLYPVGVTSSATTTLKRDTSITMKGGTITATTFTGALTGHASEDLALSGGTLTGALTGTTAEFTTVRVNKNQEADGGGLALYDTYPNNYGIACRSTANNDKHGYVQGDLSTYFYMTNGTDRGWIYRFGNYSNVASISNTGNAVFNGSVTVGGNTTNTSGCRMVYNSTTSSMDFVFA